MLTMKKVNKWDDSIRGSSSFTTTSTMMMSRLMMGLLFVVTVTLPTVSAMAGPTIQSTPISTTTTAPAVSYQLKYFNGRGVAETIRMLFALGGETYDDVRFDITPGTMDSPSFQDAKAKGELLMNMNRAPVLVVQEKEVVTDMTADGSKSDTSRITTIGQSKAIERYLARKFGLMGSSELEAAQIDCMTEHCRDIKDAQIRKRFSPFVRDRSDDDKARDKAEWFDVELPKMFQSLEACLLETSSLTGCAVGSTISLADVTLYSLIKESFPLYRDDILAAAQGCPKLLTIVDAVECHPRIAAWLKTRPESSF